MSKSVFVFMGLLIATASGANAASMPHELIGEWSPRPADACSVFTVRPDGYTGMAESEGYGCRLVRISQQRSEGRTWNAEFACSGEDPRRVRQGAIFDLRRFEGKDLLVVVERWPHGATNVLVLRRCGN